MCALNGKYIKSSLNIVFVFLEQAQVRSRLRYCIWKHWKKPNKRMRSFIRLGIRKGQAYAWSRSRMGGWATALSPIMKTTITVERLMKRGYLSFSVQLQKSFSAKPNGIQSKRSFV